MSNQKGAFGGCARWNRWRARAKLWRGLRDYEMENIRQSESRKLELPRPPKVPFHQRILGAAAKLFRRRGTEGAKR